MNQKMHANKSVVSKRTLFFLLGAMLAFFIGCHKMEPPVSAERLSDVSNANLQTLAIPEIWVNDIGARGNDNYNDTWAFQKAIDSMASLGGGVVRVRTGNYYIDVDTSIKMKSNVTLYMYDTTRKLIARPTSSGKYKIIDVRNANNVIIMGGKIIGERYIHTGPACPNDCEQGYGIAINGCRYVKVVRTHIANCWGDGIIVGGIDGGLDSRNITLKRIVSTNNRRQGMSIFRVNGLIIDSCKFMYTNGTAPQDGIDIEPDNDTAQNITITNCEIGNNVSNGIELNAKLNTSAVIRNVTIQNNYIHHSKYAGYIQNVSNLIFNNNTFDEIQYNPTVYSVNCVGCTTTPNTGG